MGTIIWALNVERVKAGQCCPGLRQTHSSRSLTASAVSVTDAGKLEPNIVTEKFYK